MWYWTMVEEPALRDAGKMSTSSRVLALYMFWFCSGATWMMLGGLQDNASGRLKCQGVRSGGRDTMRIRNEVEASSRNDSKG